MGDKHIIFDGLTNYTRGYFASWVVFFRAPHGRDLLFHYKKVLF